MIDHKGRIETILVADDDHAIRKLLGHSLRQEGYEVVLAADGREAMDLLQGHAIDVALIDVMMPRTSGYAVCKFAKSRAATRLLPVILMTGLDSQEDRIHGIEVGADDFLSKPVCREELIARVKSLARLRRYTSEMETIETVLFSMAAAVDARDPYTRGHSERIGAYAFAFGKHLSLSDDECRTLRRAGFLHDTGKIGIPDHILLAPGPLREHDREQIEQHPAIGERICAPLKSLADVLPIIRSHHERLDGSGYPDGLRGDRIPLGARIVQLADIYDALTTERPYRAALSSADALEVIRDEVKKGWWDRCLLDEFEKVLGWVTLPDDWTSQPREKDSVIFQQFDHRELHPLSQVWSSERVTC